MAKTQVDEIEAMARAILRETIERSGWYPALRGQEREQRIERDVDRHWHLMVEEARKRRDLVELHVDGSKAPAELRRERGYRKL